MRTGGLLFCQLVAFCGLIIGCGVPPGDSPESLASTVAGGASAMAQTMAVSLPFDGIAAAKWQPSGISPILSRPYKYKVPSGYDATQPTPLLILLHGLGASGELQSLYMGLAPLADSRNFLYAYPDGTQNLLGQRFWNATDFCCNFFGSTVDDVGYLTAVIDDMASRYNVDPKRIFLVGHSNGGYMSHRMACDRSSRIAGIVSLAGAQWTDATKCRPTDSVSVLEVHGTADTLVGYDGGGILYPSAHDTVNIWANRNRCLGSLTYEGKNLDLELALPGAETKVERITGCPKSGAVELWTIQGGSHVPLFTSYWPGAIYDFLSAHPKP